MWYWPKGKWKRRLAWVGLTVCLLIAPYVVSRVASPWRQVRLVSGDGGAPVEKGSGLRIVTYNIAHGRGLAESNWTGESAGERLARLDAIAERLVAWDGDIVVLTEVDFDASWSHSVNQAEYLAKKAGYPHRAEQRSIDARLLFWTWKFGNAVLSRYPIESADLVDLPGYSRAEAVLAGKKVSVACDIRVGEKLIKVIAVHFCHRSEPVRVGSSEAMVGIAEESEAPVFLAGDFNSTPPGFPRSQSTEDGRNAMSVLDQSGHFVRAPVEPTEDPGDFTFHSTRPRSVIDWVIIPQGWRFDEYEVALSELSDHRPVVVEVSAIRPD